MNHKFYISNEDKREKEVRYFSLALAVIIMLCLLISNLPLFAQSNITRTTAHIQTGAATSFASVNPSFGVCATAALSYVPVRYITLGAETGAGYLAGRGPLRQEYKAVLPNDVQFNTLYLYYGINSSLNLRAFLPRGYKERHRNFSVIPYFTFGVGYQRIMANADFKSLLPENHYEFTAYATHAGFQLRVKQNNFIDYLFTARYYYLQTYFFDAIPVRDKYDAFMTLSMGISYKFNTGYRKQYIDWAYIRKTRCPGSIRHF